MKTLMKPFYTHWKSYEQGAFTKWTLKEIMENWKLYLKHVGRDVTSGYLFIYYIFIEVQVA